MYSFNYAYNYTLLFIHEKKVRRRFYFSEAYSVYIQLNRFLVNCTLNIKLLVSITPHLLYTCNLHLSYSFPFLNFLRNECKNL